MPVLRPCAPAGVCTCAAFTVDDEHPVRLVGLPEKAHWDHVIPYLETVLSKVLEMQLDVITPSFTLAPVVAPLAEFVLQFEESLADSHEQARKLADAFTLT